MSIAVLTAISCLTAPQFLDDHDLIWEAPPARWLEGIPLANGDIGALIWGDGHPLKITLDKYDAWETREAQFTHTYGDLRRLVEQGERKQAEQIMRTENIYGDEPRPTRLPMPRFEIDFGELIEWESARLNLRTATVTIRGRVGGAPIRIMIYVNAQRNVLGLRLEGAAAAQAGVRLRLDHLNDDAKATLKRWGYPEPEIVHGDTGGSLRLAAPTGYEYAAAWKRAVANDTVSYAVSLLSNADIDEPVSAALDTAAAALENWDDALEAHETWWDAYWKRSSLTIPDARLEALYYAEMYKLGCSSRPGGIPVTLQGLWTLDGGMPPWAGDYHLDMNVQQSYWPIYTANRLEVGEPLYRTFSACIPRWRKQCEDFFGFDGIWAGCAIGPKGERIFGYSGVELWPGNAAWLAHHYWLHFLYSQDEAFLRSQALPIMRLAFLTYSNLLEKGDDGKLHVPLSYSPEWGEGSFKAYCKDPTCDLALIRFLGGALLQANDRLGEQNPLTERVREVLAELVDYPKRGNRLLISEGADLDHSHRHHSHLMAIHPLGALTIDGSDEDRDLIRGSLHHVRVKGTGEWTGWALPWMSLIASRAGYGNMAWNMLDDYANAFIKANTFHVNGDPRIFGGTLFEYEPMTLEAGFGAAAAVMEMLLQSYNGRIRLFPTVPDRWHDAYFDGLRAEGAFLITARLEDGQVRFARIVSEAGRPCTIKNPYPGAQAHLKPDGQPAQVLEGEWLAFDTVQGGSYLLHPVDNPPADADLQPPVFERTARDRNFYGVKRLPRF